MISTPDRRRIITLLNEAVEAGARLIKACDVLNLSMRTIQRWRRTDGSVREDARPTAKRPAPETKLSEFERKRILDTINQPEFANLPPAVYAGSGQCDRFCSKLSVLTGLPMMP